MDEIRKIWRKLSKVFIESPFDKAMSAFNEFIKKYRSCYPFLYQMALLPINHYPVFTEGQLIAIIGEAKELCKKIAAECSDTLLARNATLIQSLCCIILEQPDEVFSSLGDSLNTESYHEGTLIAQAFLLQGNKVKAKEIFQCEMYSSLFRLIESMLDYFELAGDDFDTAQTAFNRVMEMICLFNISKLNPNLVVKAYLFGANMYCKHGDLKKTLELLKKYSNFCTTEFLPFKLRGDDFFTDVDEWLNSKEISAAVIEEQIVKISMVHSLIAIPAFEVLKDNPQYKNIVKELTKFAKQDEP